PEPARQRPAADGRDLLERPDGDRRPAGGGDAGPARPPRPLDRRVRRDRGDGLDEPRADDRRAADRGDRRDGSQRAPDDDGRAGEAPARLVLPPADPRARLDGSAPLAETPLGDAPPELGGGDNGEGD